MRFILILIIALNTLTTFPQNSSCTKIKSRGWTQEFCDYDKKNAYKNIVFGTSFESISSRFSLTKSVTNPNNYTSKDDDAVYWGNVKFDQCLFEFNSDKKLKGVQLQMIGTSDKKEENLAAFKRIEDYLIYIFGKPEDFRESSLWQGKNITIVLGGYKKDQYGAGSLAIFTSNIDLIDGL